ncbi:hypothetical protein [Candidatus Ulvibacter alkanivorans]|uniref:hypothetical protein n=1 Tax=Candidatus Ulvibacter alkanivorans TaxID=2267620 RepID=UPI000DF28644|nr:hypothetical protein [Candidatus Ulvibacter alkanivorans]
MGQEIQENRRSRVVMAIFVHARGFSLAILKDALTVLGAYNVVLHKYPIRNRDVLRKVKEKITFYLPELVILEDADGFGSRKSKRVRRAISSIEKYAESKEIPVSKYSRNDIRFVFKAFNAHSKYEIAKVISENVKQLPVSLPGKRKSHEPEHYALKIFDAIALGITHYYQS